MMRRILLVLTVLSMVLSGCEKYNLKQPAYLHLNWKYYSQTSSQGGVEISEGYFNATSIQMTGKRVKGSDVSIHQDIGAQQVTFTTGGTLYVSVDVPMGDYTEFTSTVKLNSTTSPVARLKGKCVVQGQTLPLLIEFTNINELIFKNIDAFALKKKQDYNLFIGLDVQEMLSSISTVQWDGVQVSNENGIPTVVLRASGSTPNAIIYNEIVDELPESLKLSVE